MLSFPAWDAALTNSLRFCGAGQRPGVAQGHASVFLTKVEWFVLEFGPWGHVGPGKGSFEIGGLGVCEHDSLLESTRESPRAGEKRPRRRFASELRGWPQLACETQPKACLGPWRGFASYPKIACKSTSCGLGFRMKRTSGRDLRTVISLACAIRLWSRHFLRCTYTLLQITRESPRAGVERPAKAVNQSLAGLKLLKCATLAYEAANGHVGPYGLATRHMVMA